MFGNSECSFDLMQAADSVGCSYPFLPGFDTSEHSEHISSHTFVWNYTEHTALQKDTHDAAKSKGSVFKAFKHRMSLAKEMGILVAKRLRWNYSFSLPFLFELSQT